jgi:hypothetical protein
LPGEANGEAITLQIGPAAGAGEDVLFGDETVLGRKGTVVEIEQDVDQFLAGDHGAASSK